MRVYYHKLYKKLKLIFLKNECLFYTIILDFIIDISSARDSYIEKINDAILIVVNKLIKYIIYIINIKNFTASKLRELL